jgi:hypothetical protein
MDSRKESLRKVLIPIAKELEDTDAQETIKLTGLAYDIVQVFVSEAKVGDSSAIYPEFEDLFDVAADLELGPDVTPDFDNKVVQLKKLIKNI